MKALSIRQPWAWLIANGFKDIENRDWKPRNPGLRFRGPVLLHAGLQIDHARAREVFHNIDPCTGQRHTFWSKDLPEFELGGIVGRAVITGVVTSSESPWFVGPIGLVIEKAEPLPFIRCVGALGFFNVPPEVEAAVRKHQPEKTA